MKYFKREEFRHAPERTSPLLMGTMDRLRALAGVPIHIHVAWSDAGHSPNSMHYKGKACDFHFDGLSPLEQFACISCFPGFNGVGYYPWWNHPGWHVDLRVPRLYWTSPAQGKYIYDMKALLRTISTMK